MKTRLQNRQNRLRPQTADLKRLALFFLERAVRIDPSLDGEVSVLLMDDEGMRALNRRFSGRDETTDVLSFRYLPQAGIRGGTTGECMVNAERALQLGKRHGGVARELALYIAHACDHLTGADDADDRQRRRMRRRELRWLREAAARGLLTEDMVQT